MTGAIWWATGLAILGVIFGSFIATVAIRWPAGRSAAKGRSRCDGCDRELRARDLIPLISFAVLRGRCRDCGAAIDPFHPAIEMLGLIIGIAAGIAAPGWQGAAGAVFGWVLLTLAALDLRAFWLPDRLTATLAILGIATGFASLAPPLVDRAIGGVAGFGILWGAAALYRLLRGRDGLGGGDAKLMGAIGLWLGWRVLPNVLLAACLIGIAWIVLVRIAGRRVAATDRLPLGTLLALAAFPCWVLMAVR